MEFSIEIHAIKRGNRQIIEWTKSRKIRTLKEQGNLQILGNTGRGLHQTSEDEKKIKKSTSGQVKKDSKPNYRAKILSKGINTYAASLGWYPGLFLKWSKEELQTMDQKTRKLMTMHTSLHPCDHIDYKLRKECGRRHPIQYSVNSMIKLFKAKIKKQKNKEVCLHPQGTTLTTQKSTEQK